MNKTGKISILIIMALMGSGLGLVSNAQTAPSVSTGQVVFVAPRNVFLNATVNPNGSSTDVWFQIDTVNPPSGTRGYQGVGFGTTAINVQAGVINLNLDTAYYYRAVAQNSLGVVFGNVQSFTTPKDQNFASGSLGSSSNISNTTQNQTTYGDIIAPSVATNGPASVTANSAVLNGSIHPNNDYVNYWFEYGETSSFGQKTPIQLLGKGYSWQLVSGNITNLKPNQDYYFRIVAQNEGGTSFGETKNLRTHSGQISNQQKPNNTGGQNKTTTNNQNGVISNAIPRPIAIASTPALAVTYEYETIDKGALVVVADNLRPEPGKTFSYTIVYKNETSYSYSVANLKVIVPVEADYIDASIEPSRISGNMIEFALGNITPNSQGAVTITVKVKETTKPGTNMVFTSVLSYKDRFGVQLSSTSYLTVIVGEGDTAPLSASLSSFLSGSGIFLSAVVGFLAIFGLLVYGFVKTRNGKKNGKDENIFGFENGNGNSGPKINRVPSVFIPVDRDVVK